MECPFFNSKYYNKRCAYDSLKKTTVDEFCSPCLSAQYLGEVKANQKKNYERLKEILKGVKEL